ncbi:MAG: DNA repair protein RecN [Acidimicrobiales bacterium]
MLAELRVSHLGVIADLRVVFGPGMIALTGETGAGKTLVVEAIELLLGARADPVLVRAGAAEAVIEARFVRAVGDDDLVLSRVVPVEGRSRAYVDGRMSPLSGLGTCAGPLVDLHGQHSHQSLLSPAAQRAGLDAFGRIDLSPITHARRRLRVATDALGALGGDAASRAREQDMLRFQVEEIDGATIVDGGEDAALSEEEERLANFASHRDAASAMEVSLASDGGAADTLALAIAHASGHAPLAAIELRLRAAAIDLADTASELRSMVEQFEDDPERLEGIRQRRQLLRQMRRKYGETLDDVISYRASAAARLAELDGFEQRAADLENERDDAARDLVAAEAEVGRQRRAAAPRLAKAIQQRLRTLALPGARIEVAVGGGPAGDDVTWLLAANPGEPARPLAKVASGGELARTMLAVRLVLGPAGRGLLGDDDRPGPAGTGLLGEDNAVSRDDREVRQTLVFDEVDAGIGGEAALSVGRALADLADRYQVLVVTHLPQVAAFADQQIAVTKDEVDGRTVASIRVLDDADRVVELSRMLSGQPGSETARRHAEELLAVVGRSLRTGGA